MYMKKEILNSAWEHIEVSDECIGDLLDRIEEVPVITKKPRRKVSYLAVLTAAAVFMCGGITVAAQAGAFDWIKGFRFIEDSAVIEEENVSEIIGTMEDFKCESNVGAEFSPVGVLFDGNELYCMLKIDKLPDDIDRDKIDETMFFDHDQIKINGEYLSDIMKNGHCIYGSVSNCASADDSDNLAFQIGIGTDIGKGIIKDGDRISVMLAEASDYMELTDIANISFTLRQGNVKALDIDYSEYTCDEIPESDSDFMFNTVRITPLAIITDGDKESYENANIRDDMKVVFDDGTEVIAENNGFGGGGIEDENHKYGVIGERYFKEPIDPDKVAKVYLGDMCIFKR